MGLMDGILGGLVSAGVTSLISHFVEQHGGVQGIVSKLEQSGLGSIAQSWVSNAANQPITAEQVKSALGGTAIESLAQKFNIPTDEIYSKIAQELPEIINKMTPNGQITPAAAA